MMFEDMNEMMNSLMGGHRGGNRRRKGRNVGLALPVTFEDLYNGKSLELAREKTVLCSGCNGRGTSKAGDSGKCNSCNGAGAKLVRRQMGNMIQQMEVRCDVCNGEGFKINPKDRCKQCDGQRIKTIQAPLKVNVERGMENQHQIPFSGEGDQHPDIDPGDIVVVIQQLKHDRFTRYGSDLYLKQNITLEQALCGFKIVVTQLDGRKLLIRNDSGNIIKAGDIKCIQGEGMPNFRQPGKFGDLIIEFVINFPERLETSQMDVLRKILPPPSLPQSSMDSNQDMVFLNRQSLDEVRRTLEQEDDDDDEARNGGGLQCAQQ